MDILIDIPSVYTFCMLNECNIYSWNCYFFAVWNCLNVSTIFKRLHFVEFVKIHLESKVLRPFSSSVRSRTSISTKNGMKKIFAYVDDVGLQHMVFFCVWKKTQQSRNEYLQKCERQASVKC